MIHEPVVDIFSPPHRSSRISCSLERYIGMLIEEVEEMFLMEDKDHDDDPNIFDEAIFDIDSEKWLDAIKSKIDSIHSNQI